MIQFCGSMGIELSASAPHSQAQNGIPERRNRVDFEGVRTLLIDGNLPPFLWEEALGTVNFVRNRVPSRSLPNRNVTPFELWTAAKPNLSMLRV
jgi:hypothetical protein